MRRPTREGGYRHFFQNAFYSPNGLLWYSTFIIRSENTRFRTVNKVEMPILSCDSDRLTAKISAAEPASHKKTWLMQPRLLPADTLMSGPGDAASQSASSRDQ